MTRITQKQLQSLVDGLNSLSNLPLETRYSGDLTPDTGLHSAYHRYSGISGKDYVAAGCYFLGVRNSLERMSFTPGCTGASVVLSGGTKNQAWEKIHAYRCGLINKLP
jgi:hypothetical protein